MSSAAESASNMTPEMKKNLDFFKKNLDGWLKNEVVYRHKYVVIADEEVKRIFDNFSPALEYAANHFVAGEFIVQQVIGADEKVGFIRMAT